MATRIPRRRPKMTVTTTSPGPSNDVNQGYGYFSRWYNSSTGELFDCVDPSAGAAVWVEGGAGGGGAHVDTRDPSPTDDDTLGFDPGDFWLNTATAKVWVCLDATTSAADWRKVGSSLTDLNRYMTASVTVSDEDEACVTVMLADPEGSVRVIVNGNEVPVSDGDKEDFCYFSDDAGVTAKLLSAIASGDKLYWMGSKANYQLDANDRISFLYQE